MQTLSITQVKQALQIVVATFRNVEAYKVEVSLWDHQAAPIMQLYVACTVNGKHKSIHTKSQTLNGALEEIRQWYKNVTAIDFVIEISQS